METNNSKITEVNKHTDADYIRWKRELKSILFFFTGVCVFLIISYFAYENFK